MSKEEEKKKRGDGKEKNRKSLLPEVRWGGIEVPLGKVSAGAKAEISTFTPALTFQRILSARKAPLSLCGGEKVSDIHEARHRSRSKDE